MKALHSFPNIYVYPQHVDFRKGRRSLAAFVQGTLETDPFSKALFLFVNRRRDCVKALYWDRSGFALWEKGLEEAKFPWPKPPFSNRLEISSQQLEWLLDGVDIWRLKTHKELNYSLVI